MWRDRGRAAIYEMAGIYILITAFNIFKNRAESSGGEYILIWTFIVLFALIGLGLIGYGLYMMYQFSKENKRSQEDENDIEYEENTEISEEMEE